MIPNKVFSMIFDLLPMIVLFSLVMIFMNVIISIYSKEQIQFNKELKKLLFTVYMFLLFWLVTTTDFESYSNNFIPFKEILRYSFESVLFYRNVIGNILLFMPFGYMICDTLKEKCNKTNIFITLLIVILTSLSIEFIQMFIGRSFDVDDIILNIVGGLLGYIVYKIIHKFNNIINNEIIKSIILLGSVLIIVLLFLVLYGVI